MAVRQPRVRDREAGADDPARIRFTPAILPPYARRSKSLDTLIPILYLKGVSTGDFAPALAALLGKDGLGLSATTIARRMTFSPDSPDDIDPLASTTPAVPLGARCQRMCCSQAQLALATGGARLAGSRVSGAGKEPLKDDRPTLAGVGINKKLSARALRLAI